jgi:hypothetical protein
MNLFIQVPSRRAEDNIWRSVYWIRSPPGNRYDFLDFDTCVLVSLSRPIATITTSYRQGDPDPSPNRFAIGEEPGPGIHVKEENVKVKDEGLFKSSVWQDRWLDLRGFELAFFENANSSKVTITMSSDMLAKRDSGIQEITDIRLPPQGSPPRPARPRESQIPAECKSLLSLFTQLLKPLTNPP